MVSSRILRLVAPLVGAWIEMPCVTCVTSLFASLPSWERGLKSALRLDEMESSQVAPLVGAWIEMLILIREEI